MKFAVTGARGLLGSALLDAAEGADVSAVVLDRSRVSWLSVLETADYIDTLDVSGVIHCAANTDVEACEREPHTAYRDNTLLTELLATASARLGLRFIHISSTGVYGDHKTEPYTEFDDVRPTTAHHRSKYLGELAAARMCSDALIIRTGWLFGGAPENKKNFVANRIREARSVSGEMASNKDQFGVPTFVNDVAARIFELHAAGFSGVFNCVSHGAASRFEYVAEIVKAAGINVAVSPKDAASFRRVAPVPNNETAVNAKMDMLGMPAMRDWRAALHEYIADLPPSLS